MSCNKAGYLAGPFELAILLCCTRLATGNHCTRSHIMLRKHAAIIARINADAQIKAKLLAYFDIPPTPYLTPVLYQRGLGQADLVLALLRCGGLQGRSYVELLVGRPITVGAPCLLLYRRNGRPTVSRQPVDRRITFVQAANPRQPNTEASLRWPEFKLGRTVSQLRARGCTKRDIRRATRMGWIVFEEQAHA